MKKIFAIVLAAVMMFSLTGCFGMGGTTTTSNEPATEAPALSSYSKDFTGLQQYLIDHAFISYAKLPSTADEATTATEASSSRSVVYYELLGADDGARYLLSGNAFIEFYDFTNADNDTAKSVLSDIKEDGKLTLIEGFDELTGVLSKSGKYLALYNTKNGYDYDKITAELENW